LGFGFCLAFLTTSVPAETAQDSILSKIKPKEILQAAQTGDSTQALASGVNSFADAGSWFTEEWFRTFVPTAEIRLRLSDDLSPIGSALFLVPLFERSEINDLFFTQGSVSRFGSKTTTNIGMGYRRLVFDEKLLLGVNSFFDYEWPYNHSRTSVGTEIRTTVGEINFNYYWAMSGWKVGADGFEERALDGYDIELGMPLPYMPRTKLYGKIIEWTGQTGDFSESAISYSFEGEFYRGIILELGRRHYEDSNNENFFAVRVNLVDLVLGPKRKRPFFTKHAYQLASMSPHKYDKVRRENLIRKERRVLGNFSVTASGF
tara:strand:+ start:6588 stop:7541 length:954 start_codon:yes stop_codon:yes gene_type:complete